MIMKTAQLFAAALILSASVSAFAQTADSSNQQAKEISHGKTRAEVIAELQQAEANGKGMPSGFVAYDAPAKTSTATPASTAVARK
jgi:hypothetical protein